MMEPVPMRLLDTLAKLGKENPEEETWADLEPWVKFYWIVNLIMLPFGIIGLLSIFLE